MTEAADMSKRRRDALPLHVQISQIITRDIAAGRLVNGERLPTERKLAQIHDTTVRTLRKALARLEDQGLVERRQGSGNYIRAAETARTVYSMFRLEHAHGGGGLPNARLLAMDHLPKDAGQPDYGVSKTGTRIRRLRLLDDVVVAIEEIWLDTGAGRLSQGNIQDSLYLTYKEVLKLWISRAEDRVGLGKVPDWSPAEFAPPKGSTAAYIERIAWGQAEQAAEFSRTWFDTEKAVYVQHLI